MQEPSQHNSHREIRKTITLIAGILLLFVGIYMLYLGTAAAGTVDITTPLIKGKIETGSAGMLAVIFGFVVICMANQEKSEDSGSSSRISPIVRMFLQSNQLTLIFSFVIILMLLVLMYFLEPIRYYLLGVIGLIVVLNFRQEQR